MLIGYLAFLDPPKETTKATIEALQTYGVSTKIFTGDNDAVTRCICRQVVLKVDNLLLGSDMELLTDSQLAQVVETTNVFAKLSPEQKHELFMLCVKTVIPWDLWVTALTMHPP